VSEHTHAPDGAPLSQHVRDEIDHWVAKFPPDRKRSAVIAALHAVQHEHGYLTQQTMDAVAAAAPDTTPITSTDGQRMENALRTYRESVGQPATIKDNFEFDVSE